MTTTKANPNWKDKVLEWQASGKSARVWCLDNDIPTSTFYGWRTRLKKSHKLKSMVKPNATKIKQEFVELKDQPSSSSPLVLEYNGVKIYLQASFDKVALRQCLDCLRSSLC